MRNGFGVVVGLVVALVGRPASAGSVPADLSTWVAESYDSQDQYAGPGVWNVSADGSFVVEQENGAPTLFVSNHESVRYRITTTFNLPAADDDFVGVVLGFSPGRVDRPGRRLSADRLETTDPAGDLGRSAPAWRVGIRRLTNPGSAAAG